MPDISSLGPGAYGQGTVDSLGLAGVPAYMERMSTDIGALKKQYARLKQRQRQAHIILSCKFYCLVVTHIILSSKLYPMVVLIPFS